MPNPTLASLALLLTLALTTLPFPSAAADTTHEPIRLSTETFGTRAEVEVRGLTTEANETAARAALAEILRIESLTDPRTPAPEAQAEGSRVSLGVAEINTQAGSGPQPVDPPLLRLLERALDFCVWSRGANGPLSGRLYELWGRYGEVAAPPTPEQIRQAVTSAACDRLRLDREAGAVSLAAGSRLDVSNFARGWAVDRAVEVLREHGVDNAYVQVGATRRGLGLGPDGRGWQVVLPIFAGSHKPLGKLWLRDHALAIAHYEDHPLEVAGDRYSPFLDLRTGRSAQGIVAVIAYSELALDAQGLATTLFVTGNREGQFLLGKLRPAPAVRWLLGSGKGVPLITDYNWSESRFR